MQDENSKIDVSRPSLGDEEWHAIHESISSGWVMQGPKVKEFEQKFAQLHNVKYAFATTSGTTALHLALLALGVGPGDEVIVPSYSWISTANVVLYCNATPVFADIDAQTFNLDCAQIERLLSKKTKAIMPVHLFGLCADIDAIKEIAPGIPIVEDAACAAGALYKGKPAGSLGDIGCFSFHPRKTITTGEGGMVTTSNSDYADLIATYRNHGAQNSKIIAFEPGKTIKFSEFNVLGYNYRMTDIQAAMGIVQLSKLEKFITERTLLAQRYFELLADIPWMICPRFPKNHKHSWQAFVCLIDTKKAPCSRDELMKTLENAGISSRPGTMAIHLTGYYSKRFELEPDTLPISKQCEYNTIALPLHNCMSISDVERVVAAIHTYT
jgi:perosamine synthetase